VACDLRGSIMPLVSISNFKRLQELIISTLSGSYHTAVYSPSPTIIDVKEDTEGNYIIFGYGYIAKVDSGFSQVLWARELESNFYTFNGITGDASFSRCLDSNNDIYIALQRKTTPNTIDIHKISSVGTVLWRGAWAAGWGGSSLPLDIRVSSQELYITIGSPAIADQTNTSGVFGVYVGASALNANTGAFIRSERSLSRFSNSLKNSADPWNRSSSLMSGYYRTILSIFDSAGNVLVSKVDYPWLQNPTGDIGWKSGIEHGAHNIRLSNLDQDSYFIARQHLAYLGQGDNYLYVERGSISGTGITWKVRYAHRKSGYALSIVEEADAIVVQVLWASTMTDNTPDLFRISKATGQILSASRITFTPQVWGISCSQLSTGAAIFHQSKIALVDDLASTGTIGTFGISSLPLPTFTTQNAAYWNPYTLTFFTKVKDVDYTYSTSSDLTKLLGTDVSLDGVSMYPSEPWFNWAGASGTVNAECSGAFELLTPDFTTNTWFTGFTGFDSSVSTNIAVATTITEGVVATTNNWYDSFIDYDKTVTGSIQNSALTTGVVQTSTSWYELFVGHDATVSISIPQSATYDGLADTPNTWYDSFTMYDVSVDATKNNPTLQSV
jgi:hypothetical protein